MNPCRCGQVAADSASMSQTAAPSGLNMLPLAPTAPRRLWPSGRKNAHRGLAACRRTASGELCSQALIAPGKTRRSPTTARRSHLLQQSNYPTVIIPGLQVTVSSSSEFPASFVNNLFAPWDGWQGFESDLGCLFRCGLPGDGSVGAQLAAMGPIAAPVGEGATFTRALTAADFGPQASLSALEGTLSVNNGLATISIGNIEGNLGNAWSALNALQGAAQDAGATTLQLQGTVANPALMNALTRMLGEPGAGVLGGPQDIWTMPLGQ